MDASKNNDFNGGCLPIAILDYQSVFNTFQYCIQTLNTKILQRLWFEWGSCARRNCQGDGWGALLSRVDSCRFSHPPDPKRAWSMGNTRETAHHLWRSFHLLHYKFLSCHWYPRNTMVKYPHTGWFMSKLLFTIDYIVHSYPPELFSWFITIHIIRLWSIPSGTKKQWRMKNSPFRFRSLTSMIFRSFEASKQDKGHFPQTPPDWGLLRTN